MKNFVKSLRIILAKKDSSRILFGSSVFFFLTVLLIEKAPNLVSVFSQDFTITQKIVLSLTYLTDLQNSFTAGSIVLIVLGSILGGINLAFAYTYYKTRAKVLLRSNLYSGAGMFFAFLGIGCAACGTALLGTLLGLFGLSGVLGLLPFQGLEIGYLGLGVLLLATISLAKKVLAPNVC